MYNGTTGYYGKYVGSMYYTGNKGNDVVAKLKVDKILDYVPDLFDKINKMLEKKIDSKQEQTNRIIEQMKKNCNSNND